MNGNHTLDKAQVSHALPQPQPKDASAHSDYVHHAVMLALVASSYITWIKFTTFCYLVSASF